MRRIAALLIVSGLAIATSYGQKPGVKSIGNLLRGTKSEASGFQLPQSGQGSGVVRSYVENKDLRTSDRWTADTVYYREVKRVNGWLEGSGKALRKNELTDGAPYYRFTRLTPAGHYLRVEYMGEGNCPETMQIALLKEIKKYDYDHKNPGLFSDLAEMENRIRCVDFTPSADGERVIVEKACNKDGHFCHQMSLEKIAEDKAVGFYTIGNGTLMCLTDERYEGATGAIFEYTEEGDVKTITPIDANGWPIARLNEE
ncbi:MAG: hypothetical protein K2M06_08730 [Muribaculaceae bacterium]|nr:hypothetical protein [Muribaculaceae bacterium]